VAPLLYEQQYRNELELYTAELQHLWTWGDHTLVVGGRLQAGEQETHNNQTDGLINDGTMLIRSHIPTRSAYRRTLSARVSMPMISGICGRPSSSLVASPMTGCDSGELSTGSAVVLASDGGAAVPKGGLIFTPLSNTTVRAAYFQALTGVGLEQSVRLEPSQIAGFNQALVSLAPKAAAYLPPASTSKDGWYRSSRNGGAELFWVSPEKFSNRTDTARSAWCSLQPTPGGLFSNGPVSSES
jgi:hypothetical protein